MRYFEYLTSDHFYSEVSIFEDEENFELFGLNQLCEKVNVDGKLYLTIKQLKGFTNSLKEITNETPAKKDKQQFTLNELSNCLTIGYENTRLLFIDSRDNNSLWIFHSDGGDYEKTSMTIDKIISRI